MKQHAELERTDRIVTEFALVGAKLQRRGLELLRHRGRFHEKTIDDWLEAGRALASQPVFEVRQAGDVVEVLAAFVDVDGNALQVEATADTMVITCRAPAAASRRLFLSIRLPARIAPATIRAECRDGLLLVTAQVERRRDRPERVEVAV